MGEEETLFRSGDFLLLLIVIIVKELATKQRPDRATRYEQILQEHDQNIFGLVNKLCEIGLPMEVFLIMINIVLFSSDGLLLEQPETASAAQTYFLLFLHRYLNELFGRDDARMKLSRIMGILVDLRELCERSKEEELTRIKMSLSEGNR